MAIEALSNCVSFSILPSTRIEPTNPPWPPAALRVVILPRIAGFVVGAISVEAQPEMSESMLTSRPAKANLKDLITGTYASLFVDRAILQSLFRHVNRIILDKLRIFMGRFLRRSLRPLRDDSRLDYSKFFSSYSRGLK